MTNPLRTLVEQACRNLVVARRLPSKYGAHRVYCSPGNALRTFLFWDQRLLDVVDRFIKPGMKVWDIGANAGTLAFAAAGLGADVVAIEPDPFNVGLLHRSRTNGLPVQVVSAAVSDHVGIAVLRIAERGRASNSLEGASESTQTGGFRDRITTVCITLDWMLDHFMTPNFVKIDAEGAELLILSGADKLLSLGPALMIEAYDIHRKQIFSILSEHGYMVESVDKPGYILSDGDLGEGDIIAISTLYRVNPEIDDGPSS